MHSIYFPNLRLNLGYTLPLAWISENLDALTMRYVRHWLETPVSSCIKEWLITPKSNLGYGIPSFANRAEKLQLGKRMSLMQSKHEDIRLLWSDSSVDAIKYDSKMTSSSSSLKPIIKGSTSESV